MENAKKMIATIALILILTFAVTLVALPIVSAHDPPWDVPTWCYAYITNPVIGVNQQTVIVYWINAYPPTANGAYGDRWTFTIEVTKPDESIETLGPFTSDPVGGGWVPYTPTQVGTYTIVAKMAEHKITCSPNGFPPGWGPTTFGYISFNDTYLASASDPITLTVQTDPIEAWQETPLPTEYWTRPINSINRNWYTLAANWLAGAAQVNGSTSSFSYGTGPESAHIMWATPMWAGGIMDERFGNIGYQTSHYEGLGFTPPIILNGKIYYNVQSLPRYGWYCLDLYTGETEYFHNTTGPVTGVGNVWDPFMGWIGFDASGRIAQQELSFGQIYNYESPNQHGGFPYLWSTYGEPVVLDAFSTTNTWMMFDAYTGNYICSINNVPVWAAGGLFAFGPGATQVYGKDGSILRYNIAGTPNPMGPFFPAVPPYYLQCWNTSQAIWYEDTWQINEYWMWRPVLNMTYDGNNGYSLNVSIPNVQGSILAIREGQYIIGGTSGKNNGTYVEDGQLWALSLEKGKEGTLLWNITFTPPESVPDVVGGGMFGGGMMTGPNVDPEDDVFLFSESMGRRWWGYDLETGEMLWGPTEPEPALNFYGMSYNIYQGKLLTTGYSGEMIAYNIKTGEVLWKYIAAQEGYESPYGNYPIGISFIADGKIYLTSSEHSPTQPLWRGSYLRCVNASNGAELWKILFWGAGMGGGSGAVIADGFIVGLNLYDNQIYCLGKGPSAITVTAPESAQPLGTPVLIKGTVTDQSPGAKDTPAISDEDMTAWMEYLYMQQAKPEDAQGVQVKLTAIDPNGNFQDIGEVTADLNGNFGKMWTPPVPGEYHITATFEGSESYWPSDATTYMGVTEAPSAAQPIEPEPTEPTPTEPEPTELEPTEPEPTEPEPTEPTEAPLFSTTDLAIIAAVVVAVVIGIAAYWMLRRRR